MWFIERGNSPVVIEYDCRAKRVRKELPNAFKARQFYVAKFKEGKRPKIVRAEAAEKGEHSGSED